MAASAYRPSTGKTVMNKYVQSALQCNVVLDRLEQSSIDQIMRNSTANDDECTYSSVRIFCLRKFHSFIYTVHLYHSRHHRQHCVKLLPILVVR